MLPFFVVVVAFDLFPQLKSDEEWLLSENIHDTQPYPPENKNQQLTGAYFISAFWFDCYPATWTVSVWYRQWFFWRTWMDDVCGRRIFIVLSYFSKSKWNNYRGYEYAYATSTVENEYSNVRRQTQRLWQHSQYGGMLSRRKCLSLSFTLNAIRVLMFSAAKF